MTEEKNSRPEMEENEEDVVVEIETEKNVSAGDTLEQEDEKVQGETGEEDQDGEDVNSDKTAKEKVNDDGNKETENEGDEDNLSAEEQIEILQEKLEQAQKEKDGYYKQLARLKSDFNNYRSRVQKEKKGLKLEARVGLINEILPVLDNFERALDSSGDADDFLEGVEMIYKQLLNVLKQEGLEVIPAEGESFDHRYHEAIMRVEDVDEEAGTIVEEVQKGYLLAGKVVRPSMVKVAD